jgi:hypothetical protein
VLYSLPGAHRPRSVEILPRPLGATGAEVVVAPAPVVWAGTVVGTGLVAAVVVVVDFAAVVPGAVVGGGPGAWEAGPGTVVAGAGALAVVVVLLVSGAAGLWLLGVVLRPVVVVTLFVPGTMWPTVFLPGAVVEVVVRCALGAPVSVGLR